MPDMSSDQIRDLAVRCVEGFLNDKVPLSVGLAKEASANDLNLEQIKRACEVTNTVTHLKLMQLSEDRTVEFPLCKVAEVMHSICVPEIADRGVEKVASVQTITSPISEPSSAFEFSDHEQTIHFIKTAAANEKALESLQDRAIVVQSQLVEAASEIKKDVAWLDKISCVIAQFDDQDNRWQEMFPQISTLIAGSPASRRDFGGAMLFKEAELKQVKGFVELYKEARSLVADLSKKRELCKRAEDLNSAMVKQAFVAEVGKAIGKGLGGAIATPAKFMAGAALKTGKRAAGLVTTGVGSAMAMDALQHAGSGGAGFARNGASKNVWDALQG